MQIVAKHSAWLLISLATGGTLIFYFTDAPELLRSLAHGDVWANALGWIVVFAGTTYGLAGFAREQVCTFMCRAFKARSGSRSFHGQLPRYRRHRRTIRPVMSKLGRPRGLIDYEGWNNIERGRREEAPISRLVRPKTIGLTAPCLLLTAAIVFFPYGQDRRHAFRSSTIAIPWRSVSRTDRCATPTRSSS